jgi:hypothetical protein
MIEDMFPHAERLEMFARERRAGCDFWGNRQLDQPWQLSLRSEAVAPHVRDFGGQENCFP